MMKRILSQNNRLQDKMIRIFREMLIPKEILVKVSYRVNIGESYRKNNAKRICNVRIKGNQKEKKKNYRVNIGVNLYKKSRIKKIKENFGN